MWDVNITYQFVLFTPVANPLNAVNCIRLTLFICLSVSVLLVPSPVIHAQEMVMIVSSYARDDLCGRPQYLGVIQAIEESRYRSIPVRSTFLDSKRLPPEKVRQRVKRAVDSIGKLHPQVVVTLDDLAFYQVGCKFIGERGMHVVFSGLNRSLSFYNKRFSFLSGRTPTKNITGVYEYLFLKDQMEFLQMIFKKKGKVALLYSTDFMGEILKDQVLAELKETGFFGELKLFPVSDMKDLVKAVDDINADPSIVAYIPDTMSIPGDVPGQRKTISDLAPVLTNRAKKIDLAINRAFTRAGFFGGVSVDFMYMGYQAGRQAVMLLDGYPIRRLPVENAMRYEIIINKKRMEELSLELDGQVLNMVDEFL